MDLNKITSSQYLYYALIFVVSFITLFFLPFLGSEVGIDFKIPNTAAGWAIFAMTKGVGGVVNVMMFHFFIQQAKLNIKDNEKFKKANETLCKCSNKLVTPRSPKRFMAGQYSVKGITIFISSILSTFVMTQAILTFDWVSMLTYLFTIVFGIVFGISEMKKVELYWTEEYYNYSIMIEGELNNDNT